MSKVIVLSGPSGCGKTTYASEGLRNKITTIVSSDAIREELYGDAGVQIDHARVFAEADARVERALSLGWSVAVDATNLKPSDRASYVEAAQRHGVPCELHIFMVDRETCHKGQETRERKVPADVIERMFNTQTEDLKRPVWNFCAEGFETVKFIAR